MKANIHIWSYLAHFSLNEKYFRKERESQKTFHGQWLFFSPKNLTTYEIMWKSIVEPGRPQMTIWRMRIAWWIPKVTNTHSEYVTLSAFLLHTCIACLVIILELFKSFKYWHLRTKLIRRCCVCLYHTLSHCSRTSVACWTTRCVTGFLSFNPLALPMSLRTWPFQSCARTRYLEILFAVVFT